MDNSPLSVLLFASSFSQSVAYLVILVTKSFTEPKFFILSKSSRSVFPFVDPTCTGTPAWERHEWPMTVPHGASPDEEASSDAQWGVGGASGYCPTPISRPSLTDAPPPPAGTWGPVSQPGRLHTPPSLGWEGARPWLSPRCLAGVEQLLSKFSVLLGCSFFRD